MSYENSTRRKLYNEFRVELSNFLKTRFKLAGFTVRQVSDALRTPEAKTVLESYDRWIVYAYYGKSLTRRNGGRWDLYDWSDRVKRHLDNLSNHGLLTNDKIGGRWYYENR